MKLTNVDYNFPQIVIDRVSKKYPLAGTDQLSVAFRGFLEYVNLCVAYPDKEIPMFSESVDEVWHQFILDTRSYQKFCEEHIGYFLHHVPNGSNSSYNIQEERKKLKMLWMLACRHADIDPLKGQVPDLFAADMVLNVKNTIDVRGLVDSIRREVEQKSTGRRTVRDRVSSFFGSNRKIEVDEDDIVSYDYLLNNYIMTTTIADQPVRETFNGDDYTKAIIERIDSSYSPYSSHIAPKVDVPSVDHHSTPSHTPSHHSCSSSSSSHHSCSSSSHSCSSSSSSSSSSCSSSSSSCSSSSCSS